MPSTVDSEIRQIEQFVIQYREKFGITKLYESHLPSVSEYAVQDGEIGLLLFRQLMNTKFGYGAWPELRDDGIRKQVLDLISVEKMR